MRLKFSQLKSLLGSYLTEAESSADAISPLCIAAAAGDRDSFLILLDWLEEQNHPILRFIRKSKDVGDTLFRLSKLMGGSPLSSKGPTQSYWKGQNPVGPSKPKGYIFAGMTSVFYEDGTHVAVPPAIGDTSLIIQFASQAPMAKKFMPGFVATLPKFYSDVPLTSMSFRADSSEGVGGLRLNRVGDVWNIPDAMRLETELDAATHKMFVDHLQKVGNRARQDLDELMTALEIPKAKKVEK